MAKSSIRFVSNMVLSKRLAFWIRNDPRLTISELAKLLDVHRCKIARAIQSSKSLSRIYVKKRTNRALGDEFEVAMRDFIATNPKAKLIDLAKEFGMSPTAVSLFIRRHNISYTRKSRIPKLEIDRNVLKKALIKANWVKKDAAALLGVKPANAFYRLVNKQNFVRPNIPTENLSKYKQQKLVKAWLSAYRKQNGNCKKAR